MAFEACFICYNCSFPKNVWTDLTVGQVLEVVLAKPQTDKKTDAAYPYSAGLHPNHLPHPGYGGFTGAPYGSVSAGFGVATSFQQVFWLICIFFFLNFGYILCIGKSNA